MESWDVVESAANRLAKATTYKHKDVGLHVILVDVASPVVQGFISVATEADCDKGIPHTLEHLVFMGSERFPYKGLLDVAASRCSSRYTNAFTDVDNTTYTMSCASPEGFCRLSKIYLDSVLFPLLEECAFCTEVHSVNQLTGQDEGVVYCEMSACENQQNSLHQRYGLRGLYRNNYRYDTGGRLEPLRRLTNQEIQDYHLKTYRPENVKFLVCGDIPHEMLLSSISEYFKPLRSLVPKYMSCTERPKFQEPWRTPPDDMSASRTIVCFEPASKSTKEASASLWYRGPAISEVEKVLAIQILLDYYESDTAGPLRNVLVESSDGVAGEISSEFRQLGHSCFSFHFEGAEIDDLRRIKGMVLKVLAEELDGERLKAILRRYLESHWDGVETDSHNAWAEILLPYATNFTPSSEDRLLEKFFNVHKAFDFLKEQSLSWWEQLKNTFLLNALVVEVLCFPSALRSAEVKDHELNLSEMRLKNMTAKENVSEKKKVSNQEIQTFLEETTGKLLNFEEAGTGMLYKDVSTNFGQKPLQIWRQDGAVCPLALGVPTILIDFDDKTLPDNLPYKFAKYETTNSFLDAKVLIRLNDSILKAPLASLLDEKRMGSLPEVSLPWFEMLTVESLLPLLTDIIFKCAAYLSEDVAARLNLKPAGSRTSNAANKTKKFKSSMIRFSSSEVANIQAQRVFSYGASRGTEKPSPFDSVLSLSWCHEKTLWADSFEVMYYLFQGLRLSTDRLESISKQNLSDLLERRKQGAKVCASIAKLDDYISKSTEVQQNLATQLCLMRLINKMPELFLPAVQHLLVIYQQEFCRGRFLLVIGGSLSSLEAVWPKVQSLWNEKSSKYTFDDFVKPLVNPFVARRVKDGKQLARVITGSNLESSYIQWQSVLTCANDGAFGIETTREFAIAQIFSEYMETLYGPLFSTIRGAGLSYGVYMTVDGARHLTHLSIGPASAPGKALVASADLLKNLAKEIRDGKGPTVEDFLCSQSAACAGWVEDTKLSDCLHDRIVVWMLKRLPAFTHMEQIKLISSIKYEEWLEYTARVLDDFFADKFSTLIHVGAKAHGSDVAASMESLGIKCVQAASVEEAMGDALATCFSKAEGAWTECERQEFVRLIQGEKNSEEETDSMSSGTSSSSNDVDDEDASIREEVDDETNMDRMHAKYTNVTEVKRTQVSCSSSVDTHGHPRGFYVNQF